MTALKQERSLAAQPTHIAYAVRDFETESGEKGASWSEIGAAWLNSDGKGYNVQLTAFPVNGRLTLRLVDKRPKDTAA